MSMIESIRKELTEHVNDMISDGVLTSDNRDDWNFHAFNEDYYIIGYHAANQWLRGHGLDAFEAIGICQDYEREQFGECHKTYSDPETTVNMLVYIFGEQILADW